MNLKARRQQQYLDKIEGLVHSADKFNEMSFRMVLEGLLNKGGEEAVYLMVQYINDGNLPLETRTNIIRVVGYFQSPHFLVPLKKVIDKDHNIHLKKEAVISVSRYNDRRALNILNHARANIPNPLLQETIVHEIDKIKRNNPIFALLPRFLNAEEDPKNFHTTLDILKRVLTAADVAFFLPYLNCGRQMIENGAFDILCATADDKLEKPILKFFQDRFDWHALGGKPLRADRPAPPPISKEQFYSLVLKLRDYFVKNPLLIDRNLENLGTQLLHIKDPRIQAVFISIICRSRQQTVLNFASQIYDLMVALRKAIIHEYAKNEAAVDLLFEKYQTADESLKDPLIDALLHSPKGLDYFHAHFHSLEDTEQTIVVNHLPYGGRHNLDGFGRLIFETDRFELKSTLLKKVKAHHELSVKDILFDPAREEEFAAMGQEEYLETITRLFPVTATRRLLDKIISSAPSAVQSRAYLEKIRSIISMGFAFNFRERDFGRHLYEKIVAADSPELNVLFLDVLRQVKTFDPHSFRNLDQIARLFASPRDGGITSEETGALKRVRHNLNELYYDVRRVEEGLKAMGKIFNRPRLDFGQISAFFTRYPMCTALFINWIIHFIGKRLPESGTEALDPWIKLFYRYPMIGLRVKSIILEALRRQKQPVHYSNLKNLYQALPDNPGKLVMHLSDRMLVTNLWDQCQELIPEIPITTDKDQWREGDLLVCDGETLKDFILDNEIPSRKLFVLLDKGTDFSSIKSYNPQPLVKPFYAYKIVREILKEVYV